MSDEKILIIISAATCHHCYKLYPMLEPLAVELNKLKYNFIFINKPTMDVTEKYMISPIFTKINHYPFIFHTTTGIWHEILDGNKSRYNELNVLGAYYDGDAQIFRPNTVIKYSPYDTTSLLLWLNNEKRDITTFNNILNKYKHVLEDKLHKLDDIFTPDVFTTLTELDKDIIEYFSTHNEKYKKDYFSLGIKLYYLIQKYALKYTGMPHERKQFLLILCDYYNKDMIDKCTLVFDYGQDFGFDLVSLVKIIAGETVANEGDIIWGYIEFLFKNNDVEEFVALTDMIKTFINKIYEK